MMMRSHHSTRVQASGGNEVRGKTRGGIGGVRRAIEMTVTLLTYSTGMYASDVTLSSKPFRSFLQFELFPHQQRRSKACLCHQQRIICLSPNHSIETRLLFIVVDHRSANHENCYCWNLLGSIDRVGLCAAIDWVGGRRRTMGRGWTMPGLICVCSWQSSERSYLSRSDIGTDPSKRMFGSAFLSTLPSYIRPFYNFALPQTTPNHSFRVHFPSSVFDDNGQ